MIFICCCIPFTKKKKIPSPFITVQYDIEFAFRSPQQVTDSDVKVVEILVAYWKFYKFVFKILVPEFCSNPRI